MTEAPPEHEAGPEQQERVLARAQQGRLLTGVCAGLGRYTGIDPVLFRVGFAVFVLGSGFGIILYIAAYLLMREPNGNPGHVERWTRRLFEPQTVLALLTAVSAFGLMINLLGGIGKGVIVVATIMAVALLTAHNRGVDVMAMVKSLPEVITGKRGMTRAPEATFAAYPPPSAPSASYTPPSAAAPASDTGYRRLSDLAREARSTGDPTSYASHEPYAPHGPYARTAPRPPAPPAPPAQPPYAYGPPPRPARVKQRKPKSFVGAATFFVALAVGGIMVAQPAGQNDLTLIGGAVLITFGAGLLVAAWYGRGGGLVALGVMLSLLLVAGSSVNGIPKKFGSYSWRPEGLSQSVHSYTVGVGEGRLDLSKITLVPGTRIRYDASVSFGQFTVIVPTAARIEVFGSTRLGDVKIGNTVEDGTSVTLHRVMLPEASDTDVATIELHVKAGIGDVEVLRGAA
ncbi:PspC domain-containing protein [Streptosporangiaceae bacterium NEAU-GS5]|nr:PspC domain-containing protein [Streptosporangiaceae bacterium NEAU-GS5]